VYKNTYDLCAYYGLVKKEYKMQKIIQEQIIATNRERGNCMFDLEWQKEMANRPKSSYYFQKNPLFASQVGTKGGILGGKVMTDKKKQILKENGYRVGTLFGKQGGIKHQNEITKTRLQKSFEWYHDSGVSARTFPCETLGELQAQLNTAVPKSVKYSNALRQILRNSPPRRYGWQIIKEIF